MFADAPDHVTHMTLLSLLKTTEQTVKGQGYASFAMLPVLKIYFNATHFFVH